jgi:hypothetical protein
MHYEVGPHDDRVEDGGKDQEQGGPETAGEQSE